jgi:hypothetical protein
LENVDLEWVGSLKIDLRETGCGGWAVNGHGSGSWLILAMLDLRVLLLKCGLANSIFKIVYKVSLILIKFLLHEVKDHFSFLENM